MVQTSYSLDLDHAVAGLKTYMEAESIFTMNNPSKAVWFGRAVEKISGDEDGVKPPDNGSAVLSGVAVKDPTETEDYYPLNSAVAVMKVGQVWVDVEEAVTPDDDVYVRHTGVAQVQTFVLDADIVVGNTVVVTVDGVVLTQAYDTSHLNTMNLLAAKIQAQGSVNTAVVGGAGNRTITITSVIAESTASTVLSDEGITGGASQANITITETTTGIASNMRGAFRTDTDGGTALQWENAKFMSTSTGAGLALLNVATT